MPNAANDVRPTSMPPDCAKVGNVHYAAATSTASHNGELQPTSDNENRPRLRYMDRMSLFKPNPLVRPGS